MPRVVVKKYEVTLQSAAGFGAGKRLRITPGPVHPDLLSSVLHAGTIQDITLLFELPDAYIIKEQKAIGTIIDHRIMNVHFPESMFTTVYDVLKTEKPVFLRWQVDDERRDWVISCSVQTGEEPPGDVEVLP